MAERDFQSAYEETMRNDPKGMEVMEAVIRIITQDFDDPGILKK